MGEIGNERSSRMGDRIARRSKRSTKGKETGICCRRYERRANNKVDLICEMNLYVRLFARMYLLNRQPLSQHSRFFVGDSSVSISGKVRSKKCNCMIVAFPYPGDGRINRSTKLRRIVELRIYLLLLFYIIKTIT